MIIRLIGLIKYWTFLIALGFSFTSCIGGNSEDIRLVRDDLLAPLMDISAYITGEQKEVDDNGNILGVTPCEKNYAKAHELFLEVLKKLKEYPSIIRYPIASSLLKELQAILNELKQDIANLPDGQEKNQFEREYTQLYDCISSLIMAQKNES
ncbi:hypothetical protein [Cardinium endosymbiont of Philonthus spinipes]|uniref:hypothetical protein n=1 Tax=Cardinium endosymbiont of Philonthus spinipes TaxID=3077941 RepID=UPI00313F3DAA